MIATPALAQLEPVPPPYVKGSTVEATELGPIGEGIVRVNVQTPEGLIVLDLNQGKAPITAGNFLRYVDSKRFDGIHFYRASHPPGETDYGVVQGGLENSPEKLFKPIAHEPTNKTGIFHRHGTVSMARNAPGTATADFFICVGEQSYLDAHPEQPGDNQGFAAFGTVALGMPVVRKILAMDTGGSARNPAMKGEILTKPVLISSMRRA